MHYLYCIWFLSATFFWTNNIREICFFGSSKLTLELMSKFPLFSPSFLLYHVQEEQWTTDTRFVVLFSFIHLSLIHLIFHSCFFKGCHPKGMDLFIYYFSTHTITIILQRQRIKPTKMPWAGFEPLTLGVARSDDDHKTM